MHQLVSRIGNSGRWPVDRFLISSDQGAGRWGRAPQSWVPWWATAARCVVALLSRLLSVLRHPDSASASDAGMPLLHPEKVTPYLRGRLQLGN
jgi:hypothetical protein